MDVAATADQGGVAQAARERCREHLRHHRDFAFNATNLREQTRSRWVRLFDEYGARVQIAYLEPPLATILDRNRRRQGRVPDEVILKLWDRIEPPTWAECHELAVIPDAPEP